MERPGSAVQILLSFAVHIRETCLLKSRDFIITFLPERSRREAFRWPAQRLVGREAPAQVFNFFYKVQCEVASKLNSVWRYTLVEQYDFCVYCATRIGFWGRLCYKLSRISLVIHEAAATLACSFKVCMEE